MVDPWKWRSTEGFTNKLFIFPDRKYNTKDAKMSFKDSLLTSFKEYASKCSAARYFNAERTSELSKAIHREAVAFVDHVMSKLYTNNLQTEQSLKDEIAHLTQIISNLEMVNLTLDEECSDLHARLTQALSNIEELSERNNQLEKEISLLQEECKELERTAKIQPW